MQRQRKCSRYIFKMASEWVCHLNENTLLGFHVHDISPWGARLFLSPFEAPERGDVVRLAFLKKGVLQFTANGLVKWKNVGFLEHQGFFIGIEFSSGDADVLPLWESSDIFQSVTETFTPEGPSK